MIEIRHLTKKYPGKLAVDDISFTINRGEILGLLGRNGAGKSTTMNIITGCLSPTSGNVVLDGHDITAEPEQVKRRIGYLPEFPPLYDDMTAHEYLQFCCRIKGVDKRQIPSHIRDIAELTDITDQLPRLIRHLSKGYRQRVGLAQALVGSPDVIILDEPTVGLDPRQIAQMRALIKQLGERHTVVLSSHILSEVQDVCQRVVIMSRGRIVAEDSLPNLTSAGGDVKRLRLRVAGAEKRVAPLIEALPGVLDVRALGEREPGSMDFEIETAHDRDIRRPLFDAMARADAPILMLKPMEADLMDVFLKLTGDEEALP